MELKTTFNMYLIKKALVVAVILFLNACNVKNEKNNQVEQFGIAFNKTRSEIGLPLLDSSWKISNESDEMLQWMPIRPKDSLSFVLKRMLFKNGDLNREENVFNGKRTYTTTEGTLIEKLYVSYNFLQSGPAGKWICEYYGLKKEFGEMIPKEQADSILLSWGLK
jgi:hypothetical protein